MRPDVPDVLHLRTGVAQAEVELDGGVAGQRAVALHRAPGEPDEERDICQIEAVAGGGSGVQIFMGHIFRGLANPCICAGIIDSRTNAISGQNALFQLWVVL